MTSFDLDACLRCLACELATTRQKVVVCRGNPKAPLKPGVFLRTSVPEVVDVFDDVLLGATSIGRPSGCLALTCDNTNLSFLFFRKNISLSYAHSNLYCDISFSLRKER